MCRQRSSMSSRNMQIRRQNAQKLNKLGTQEWGRDQDKSTQCGQKHRKDLVQLYAARQREEGFCYGEDTIWQKEFEETFPFDETDDQLEAIEAVETRYGEQ